MLPIVNGLESEFEGQVAVVRLNASDAAVVRLQEQYGGRGHPFFVVIDGESQITERFFGPQPAEVLREAMAAVQP